MQRKHSNLLQFPYFVVGPPEPDPQPPQAKRPFFGNQHTEARFYGQYQAWLNKLSRHYRIPAACIDEQIWNARAERRAA